MPPWPVVDGQLSDPRSLQLEQRGQEAMHAVEQREAPQKLGAVDAQGATDVGDRFVGQPIARATGDARGNPAQPGILAVGSYAADHFTAVEASEKPGDIRRIVL